jgi:ABC-2 type transport system permease protein
MRKVISITWKDLVILFRDRAALILMFVVPLALTIGIGAITGSFGSQSGSSNSSIGDIPIIVFNQDDGDLGASLQQALTSPEMGGLFAVSTGQDLAGARKQVENDQAAAVVVIPAGFSASLIPDQQNGQTGPAAPVEVYASPERPNSARIVRLVIDQIIAGMASRPLGVQVALEGLLASGRLTQDAAALKQATTDLQQIASSQESPIQVRLQQGAQTAQNQPPNPLSYLAPAFAVFSLMYTVTLGGRSILIEREYGTLARLLTTPTSNAQVLAGKVFGIFSSGFLQVGILILASAALFGLRWGDPLAVTLLVVSVSLAATGWGILLAALATSPWQVGGVGSVMMIIFGLLGGTFIPATQFPQLIRTLARLTPNYWSNNGFIVLSSGGGLAEIMPILGALLAMAVVLFAVSVLFARRRWASGFAKK